MSTEIAALETNMSPDLSEESEEKQEDSSASTSNPDAEFGGHEARQRLERRLLRKLDCRMFILVIIYILNYVDRNNAAAARLRGFESDLNLKGQEFNTLLSILYVGYILMQIPSNMFLNYIGRPSIYLPLCMTVWGMISILTGITKDFVGALLTRFFLGFVEAAFFPGALFVLSKWYTREELGLRISIMYCGNIISNAFGSLLASGILDGMQGKLGRAAWRWLFYIEGSLTIAVALSAIFILPDFPTNTRWLTDEERRLAIKRMAGDGGLNLGDQDELEPIIRDSEKDTEKGNGTHLPPGTGITHSKATKWFHLGSHGEGFWLAMSDWKVWWLALMLTTQVNALSFNAFFPTLSATLGFNRTISLVLVAPPFIVTAICVFLVSRHSDKKGERFWHIVCPLILGLAGYVIAMSTMNVAARYVSLFLMSLSYCGYIIMFAWISNSIPRPPAKRAVALAFTNCFSQLGNIAGSYVWPLAWGPSYRNSYAICISCQSLAIIMCWIFRRHLQTLNRKLEEEEQVEGRTHKGFRYLL